MHRVLGIYSYGRNCHSANLPTRAVQVCAPCPGYHRGSFAEYLHRECRRVGDSIYQYGSGGKSTYFCEIQNFLGFRPKFPAKPSPFEAIFEVGSGNLVRSPVRGCNRGCGQPEFPKCLLHLRQISGASPIERFRKQSDDRGNPSAEARTVSTVGALSFGSFKKPEFNFQTIPTSTGKSAMSFSIQFSVVKTGSTFPSKPHTALSLLVVVSLRPMWESITRTVCTTTAFLVEAFLVIGTTQFVTLSITSTIGTQHETSTP